MTKIADSEDVSIQRCMGVLRKRAPTESSKMKVGSVYVVENVELIVSTGGLGCLEGKREDTRAKFLYIIGGDLKKGKISLTAP